MDHLHAKRLFVVVFNAIKFMNRTNNDSTMFYELCHSPQYKNVFGNVKKHICVFVCVCILFGFWFLSYFVCNNPSIMLVNW